MNHNSRQPERARRGLAALHRAVRNEVEKKSKLGQYVIVFRQGKTVRMLASEALKTADAVAVQAAASRHKGHRPAH